MNSFIYGKTIIHYELVFEERRTVQYTVFPDSSVLVKAPAAASLQDIEYKLQKKARWIIRQQDYFRQFSPLTPPRYFINGETHLYLGRHYRLSVVTGIKNEVKLKEGRFFVTCKGDTSPANVKSLMETWYSQRSKEVYAERFEQCWKQFDQPELSRPTIAIRKLRTRWGSLSPKGRLTLNANLIKAPKTCIDYVIMHELCHLVFPNHNTKFYRLLESQMPDWAEKKNRLEDILS